MLVQMCDSAQAKAAKERQKEAGGDQTLPAAKCDSVIFSVSTFEAGPSGLKTGTKAKAGINPSPNTGQASDLLGKRQASLAGP